MVSKMAYYSKALSGLRCLLVVTEKCDQGEACGDW